MPDIGSVTLIKRKGSRHIRLSVTSEGLVRVSLPTWLPYATGIAFAKQKTAWLQSQIKPPFLLRQHMLIGKEHRLEFIRSVSSKLSTRINPNTIRIHVPLGSKISDADVQAIAVKACIRALKQESEAALPARLRLLAKNHNFDFRSVEVKRLKSRWGSCSNRREIVLNCFLMQLPWDLIDYVLLHELMHTRIMAHGPKFWGELGKYVTDLPAKRKSIRDHRPTVRGTLNMSSMA